MESNAQLAVTKATDIPIAVVAEDRLLTEVEVEQNPQWKQAEAPPKRMSLGWKLLIFVASFIGTYLIVPFIIEFFVRLFDLLVMAVGWLILISFVIGAFQVLSHSGGHRGSRNGGRRRRR